MIAPTRDLRARFALMERMGTELGIAASGDCPHPLEALRYDGIQQTFDGPMASVTCTEPGCWTSRLIAVREDVARLHCHTP